ncbi:MAG: hypothetical protein WCK31_04520, partial [bacterium]
SLNVFVSDLAYKNYMDFINDPEVYDQDDVLKVLNTGTVMTDEMFESVKRLFESSDDTNTTLGMETLANCDYEASAVPILLLLKQYGSRMYGVTGSQHVNFKSLLKFFNITNLSGISLDTVIDCLRHQELLTPDNLNRIMPLAKSQMCEDARLRNFSVTHVDINPSLLSEIQDVPVTLSGMVELIDDDEEELNMNI